MKYQEQTKHHISHNYGEIKRNTGQSTYEDKSLQNLQYNQKDILEINVELVPKAKVKTRKPVKRVRKQFKVDRVRGGEYGDKTLGPKIKKPIKINRIKKNLKKQILVKKRK